MKYINNIIRLIQEDKLKEIIFYELYLGRGNALFKGASEYAFTTGIRLIEIIQANPNKILEVLLEYEKFVSRIQNDEEEDIDLEDYMANPITFGDWYSDYIGEPIEVLFHEAVIEYKTIVTTDHSIVEYIESKAPTFEDLLRIEDNIQELKDDDLDHDDYGIIILGRNIDLPNMFMKI